MQANAQKALIAVAHAGASSWGRLTRSAVLRGTID